MKALQWAVGRAVLYFNSNFITRLCRRHFAVPGPWRRVLLSAAVCMTSMGWTQALPPILDSVSGRQAMQTDQSPPFSASARRSPVTRGPRSAATMATPSTAVWQSIGPAAVSTTDFGLVSGRVLALAFDPADPTGNRLYLGAAGGGVWLSQNADTSDLTYLAFQPLTDTVSALDGVVEPSISIGALTVQPGATGVVLAGTGEPNDAMDSYYGAGILRSTDGGDSWSLIQMTADRLFGFLGEGFAGFAWSTSSPQTVVAAVSQALEGTRVNALVSGLSYTGLYSSADSGATWNLATIQDPGGLDVQGPTDGFVLPDGNPATAVIWNPVRQLFLAAVRFHGYYQSADGVTWTRLTAQPGSKLTTQNCPTQSGVTGSTACPIFRGALAVNPQTGDTFAWTVDRNNQDQGIWQDLCAAKAGACTNPSLTFSKQWDTTALQAVTSLGAATITNGDYDLTLAAVPSGQDTLLLAGANDLWKCSLASNCAWRNTTNATTCKSAAVGAFQHSLAWNSSNPVEIFVGNDSGLWRSDDAIGETGATCAASDADHFQNLNGGFDSLAEVGSLAQSPNSPYLLMAGLGGNGATGARAASAPAGNWPEILSGEGGPVAIDPQDDRNWYVNNASGVSIQACSGASLCTPSAFGSAPVITDADVAGDGAGMTTPAPFLIDPLDHTQLLVATCRVWRGPATGGWLASNAISPIFGNSLSATTCNGSAFIHTMAAIDLGNGQELVYLGFSGFADGGANLAGHVFSATIDTASGKMPTWTDLTLHTVTNDTRTFNSFGMEVSSILIDPHDPTGQTVYVTIAGTMQTGMPVRTVYRSTSGGATWTEIVSNLPQIPVNSLVVDPQDANTVYVATDHLVYSTRAISACGESYSTCWSVYGTGLPASPVLVLTVPSSSASVQLLTAATYGRGIWQIPLWTAGNQQNLTTATADPSSMTFPSQPSNTSSAAQTVTVTNTGANALTVSAITLTGDFSETDNCVSGSVAQGATCAIQVTFTPTATGLRTGSAAIAANVAGGSLTVTLSGTGVASLPVNLSPATVAFDPTPVGKTSSSLQVTATNSNSFPVAISSETVSGPFALASNSCGTTSLAANAACQLTVEFQPTAAGAASGALTFVDAAGTQTVSLTGTGQAPATDTLSTSSLTFPATILHQLSAPQMVAINNSGDLSLTQIATTVSGAFQIASNTCGTQLPGQSSCAVSVVFIPTATGSQSGVLTIVDSIRTQTVPLSGVGLLPPVITPSPASLSFAAQPVNTTSAAQTVTVTNTGGAPMANVGFQIIGGSAASFATAATTCGASQGSALDAGSSCTVQVTFTPKASCGNSATLVISSSTLGVTAAQVPLIGDGTSTMGLLASPCRLSFPATVLGQSSAVLSVTISNADSHQNADLSVSVNAPFALAESTCGASLDAAASCSASLIFSPITSGAVTGVLSIISPSATTPASVALSGTGALPPSIQATPAVINFAATGVGNTSAAATVTITNTGTLGSVTGLSLSASAGFQLVANTCAESLGPQASCTVGAAFAPSAAGPQTGAITIASDVSKTATQVVLSGSGVDFSVTPLGSSSQTISSGQVANYSLKITPLGGVQADYALQCGSLPAQTLCAFNPGSETISGNSTGTVAVMISTGQSASSQWQRQHASGRWRVLPLLCALLLLPLARKRGTRLLRMVAAFAILFGGLVSCVSSGGGTGGAGANSSSVGATQAGTYSIPITVTSNGLSRNLTLTLVVD